MNLPVREIAVRRMLAEVLEVLTDNAVSIGTRTKRDGGVCGGGWGGSDGRRQRG